MPSRLGGEGFEGISERADGRSPSMDLAMLEETDATDSNVPVSSRVASPRPSTRSSSESLGHTVPKSSYGPTESPVDTLMRDTYRDDISDVDDELGDFSGSEVSNDLRVDSSLDYLPTIVVDQALSPTIFLRAKRSRTTVIVHPPTMPRLRHTRVSMPCVDIERQGVPRVRYHRDPDGWQESRAEVLFPELVAQYPNNAFGTTLVVATSTSTRTSTIPATRSLPIPNPPPVSSLIINVTPQPLNPTSSMQSGTVPHRNVVNRRTKPVMNPSTGSQLKYIPVERQPFQCTQPCRIGGQMCGTRFTRLFDLSRHMKSLHLKPLRPGATDCGCGTCKKARKGTMY
ncbi:hypothetical protein HDU93_005042 [Gonapodya sp. JEL0774]|nr:hypothetical protein HDU93_005042 [Gonapodya sp. JEL0774]